MRTCTQRSNSVQRVGLILLALLAQPSTALADSEIGGRAPRLSPIQPTIAPVTPAISAKAVAPRASYRCDEPGTPRRRSNSYAIGWCTVGMHIDISTGQTTSGWQGGWGEGNFNGCGWFQSSKHPLTREGSWDHSCGDRTYNENEFGQIFNIAPDDDGAEVRVLKSCPRFLNVRPWISSPTVGADHVGTLLTTDVFKWRYLTKNGAWVMGRLDRAGVRVRYDWAFVARDCVAQPPVRAARTNDDH